MGRKPLLRSSDRTNFAVVILDCLIAAQICCADIGFLPFPGEQCAGKGRDPHAAGLGSYPDGRRIEVIDPKRITASKSGHHSIDCGVVGYFDCVKGNSLRICSSFIMVLPPA